MTVVELMLWQRLRRRQVLGFKFRRQAVVGPFVADFVCRSARLIIEVDGRYHDFTERYDSTRDAWLGSHGFRVWRVGADEVLQNLDGVVEAIGYQLQADPLPRPDGRDLPA